MSISVYLFRARWEIKLEEPRKAKSPAGAGTEKGKGRLTEKAL